MNFVEEGVKWIDTETLKSELKHKNEQTKNHYDVIHVIFQRLVRVCVMFVSQY